MNERVLGKTGIRVSEVGLGCWQLAGDWHPVSERTAYDILATALDNGVRFFDTADVYGNGMSEWRIGNFLKDCSERVYVATKVGRSESLFPDKYNLQHITEHVEGSLRRLSVEALDLVQLHCVPPKILEQGDIFRWLDILQEQGKIIHWGASVETIDEALLCLEQPNLVSLQIIFNTLRQKPIEGILKQAAEKKVGIIARLPLASGLLSGKFDEDTEFGEKDPRHYNCDGQIFNVGEIFGGLTFARGLDIVKQLREWVPDNMTMAQMALRWLLDFSEVTTVIPGATRPEQIRSNAAAATFPRLPADLHQQLHAFYWGYIHDHIRGAY